MRAREFIIKEGKSDGAVPHNLDQSSHGAIRSRDVGGYDRIHMYAKIADYFNVHLKK